MYYRNHATQAQINAHRDAIRAELDGKGFKIDSNAYGLLIRCNTCGDSNTLNPEHWARSHSHDVIIPGEGAWTPTSRTVTENADGTTTTVLNFA